jgi:choline dehydrogenase-like flavoprotein
MFAERLTSEPAPGPSYPDDPENLPEGSVVEGHAVRRDVHDIADFVVIGSGAAGASAAAVLSARGYSVALIEEGPWVRTREISPDMLHSFKRVMRGLATNMVVGRAMFPLLQGRCVGGSTAINSAIAWLPPERILMRWEREFGLGSTLSARSLEPHFQEIERALNVRSVEDATLGESNRLFGEAAELVGIRSERIRRYENGCEGSGLCLTGCMRGKKLSMNITHVPEVLRAGGRIYTSARVERVEAERGRAAVVRARFDGPKKAVLRVRARRGVLVAASAVQTPGVLRRSGLRNRHLGRHFQAHPGLSVAGSFDRPIRMSFGATQGWNSLHYAESEGFKLETVSLPPELAAIRLPGFGPNLVKQLMDYPNLASWAVIVKADAEGEVITSFGQETAKYQMTTRDIMRMRSGLKLLSEMMFAAGAREVWPAVWGMPKVLTSRDQVRLWDNAPLDARAYTPMASHLFGSTRMGVDPGASVVDTQFETHELPGLYVVDSSVFPTNIGVNPQHTIMAVARLGATLIAERPLPAAF